MKEWVREQDIYIYLPELQAKMQELDKGKPIDFIAPPIGSFVPTGPAPCIELDKILQLAKKAIETAIHRELNKKDGEFVIEEIKKYRNSTEPRGECGGCKNLKGRFCLLGANHCTRMADDCYTTE